MIEVTKKFKNYTSNMSFFIYFIFKVPVLKVFKKINLLLQRFIVVYYKTVFFIVKFCIEV